MTLTSSATPKGPLLVEAIHVSYSLSHSDFFSVGLVEKMGTTRLDTGVLIEPLGKQTMSFLLKVIEAVALGDTTDHRRSKQAHG